MIVIFDCQRGAGERLRCATFGAAGEWRLILPSLIIGALFGYLMKASGLWLSQKTLSTDGVSDPA